MTTNSLPPSAKLLDSQVALVTGGSRGIGACTVLRLASIGATVVLNYAKSAAAAEEVAAKAESLGGRVVLKQFDISNEAETVRGFDETLKELGRLDILVNNAGVAIDSLFVRTDTALWEKTMQTNLNGCFYASRAASKAMMKQRYGRIINISSVIGEMGNAGQVAYSTSKSALFGFTKSLARELGSRNVTVNAVTPGYIQTDMTSGMTEEQNEKLKSVIALGRLGSPEDIAGAVAFLVGPDASYITGHILSVNGGMYM